MPSTTSATVDGHGAYGSGTIRHQCAVLNQLARLLGLGLVIVVHDRVRVGSMHSESVWELKSSAPLPPGGRNAFCSGTRAYVWAISCRDRV